MDDDRSHPRRSSRGAARRVRRAGPRGAGSCAERASARRPQRRRRVRASKLWTASSPVEVDDSEANNVPPSAREAQVVDPDDVRGLSDVDATYRVSRTVGCEPPSASASRRAVEVQGRGIHAPAGSRATAPASSGRRVDEAQIPLRVLDRQACAPSGLRASARHARADRQDADRGRALEQRSEQVPARLDRVLERDALAREQQRAVDLVRGQRLRAEPLRGRGAACARARLRWSSATSAGDTASRAALPCPRARRAGGAGRGRSRAGRRPGRLARWHRARRRSRPPIRARRPAARRGRGRRDRGRRRPRRAPPRPAGDGGGGRARPPPASRAVAATRAAAPRAPPRPCRRRRSAAGAR